MYRVREAKSLRVNVLSSVVFAFGVCSPEKSISSAVSILTGFNMDTALGKGVPNYVFTTKFTRIGLCSTLSHFMIIKKL